jgi:hypothetical protein
MQIGEKTIKAGGEIITNAMLSYLTKINEAFNNNGEEDLKIGLSLTIKPGPATGNFKLKAGIDFVTQKIKDTFSGNVDEVQANLFEDYEKVNCPKEQRPVNVAVCEESCRDRYSPLYASENGGPEYYIGGMPCRAWADADHRAFWERIIADHDARPEPGEDAPEPLAA